MTNVTAASPKPTAMLLRVNGTERSLPADARVSLLDALRGEFELPGTKIGCNQGGCGACTVLLDGERVLSCLTLAVQCEGRDVTTIEGLRTATGELHALQRAFIDNDGFQCGYCTPGQICSAVGMAEEVRRGLPSAISDDIAAEAFEFTREEIRERMSGNLCRCGAYNGIVDAIRDTFAEKATR
jgi:xanthine dehydrogenase YagT iron-sulfur-binding subunit